MSMSEAPSNSALMRDLVSCRLENYRKSLVRSFHSLDFEALSEVTSDLEKDCSMIGAVELCGKISRFKRELSENSQNQGIIFSCLLGIDQGIVELTHFLKIYLGDEQSTDDECSIKSASYNSLPEERISSWTCSIQ